jgi:TonB family protein
MGKNFRIDGYVLVDILVNSKGTVECARLIDGHPMLANSAIDAVKDWTFRSMKQHGRSVAFYGHLRFHYSTKEPIKNGTPCIEAH